MPNQPTPVEPLRVLVVDDNADAADSLALLLSLDGPAVQTAGDGQQALQAAAAFQPAVVLLDIGLPDMTGYQVAAALRALPRGAALVLIAVTGWGGGAEARSLSAGFNHHLTKPVDPQRLHLLLGIAAAGS